MESLHLTSNRSLGRDFWKEADTDITISELMTSVCPITICLKIFRKLYSPATSSAPNDHILLVKSIIKMAEMDQMKYSKSAYSYSLLTVLTRHYMHLYRSIIVLSFSY